MNLEELNKTPFGTRITLDENEGIFGYFGGVVKDNHSYKDEQQILLITSLITHKAGEDCFGTSQTESYKADSSTYSLNSLIRDKKIVECNRDIDEGWCDLKKGFSNILMDTINFQRSLYGGVSQ